MSTLKLAVGMTAILLLAAPGAIAPAAAQLSLGFSLGGPAPPPPPRVVVRPAPPREHMVWREGHYGWRNGAYVWIGGDWSEPPYTDATWVPGHWVFRDGRNIYIEGHWEG